MTLVTVPARSAGPAGWDERRWRVLPILLLGIFLPVFGFFVVTISLPAIAADLQASGADLQFIVAGYTAVYAVFLVTGGRLGDLFGRKRLFLAGLLAFTLASLGCGLAGSAPTLVAWRLLQGLGAAMMAPQALALIKASFPPEEQPAALSALGVTYCGAAVAGQLLSGVLAGISVAGLSWQLVFLVNIPLGLAGLVAAAVMLRESQPPQRDALDLGGLVAFTLAFGLLVFPLIEGREAGWPPWVAGMMAASAAAFVLFHRIERRVAARGGTPLVDFALFADARLRWGLLAALLFNAVAAFFLAFPLYLQGGLGLGPVATSLTFLPFGLGWFGISLLLGWLRRRLGRRVIHLGAGLMILGHVAILAASVADGAMMLHLVGLLLFGAGQGIYLPSLLLEVMAEVAVDLAGLASGIFNTTIQLGVAIATATLGTVLFAVLGDGTAPADYVRAFQACQGLVILLLFAALAAGVPAVGGRR